MKKKAYLLYSYTETHNMYVLNYIIERGFVLICEKKKILQFAVIFFEVF
jgi:hypothetical protein